VNQALLDRVRRINKRFTNILASQTCGLRWKNCDYALVNPRFVEAETGLVAFPALARFLLRRVRIEYYLKLDIQA
jgi:hypothetical protein